MAWRIDYTDTARAQLKKIDRATARRVIDYMQRRVAPANPRSVGQALTGPLGKLWRYRVGSLRVVCEVRDDVKHVLVLRIARRDKVYR